TVLDTVALPAGLVARQVAASRWGIAVTDGEQLFVQPFGGTWHRVAIDAPILSISAHPDHSNVVALLRGKRMAVYAPHNVDSYNLPDRTAPLFVLVSGADTVVVGEPRGAPGKSAETRFVELTLTPPSRARATASYGVRGFDGRALWLDGSTVFASTATGA